MSVRSLLSHLCCNLIIGQLSKSRLRDARFICTRPCSWQAAELTECTLCNSVAIVLGLKKLRHQPCRDSLDMGTTTSDLCGNQNAQWWGRAPAVLPAGLML